MNGIKFIGLGWTAFIAENIILSHNRSEIIEIINEDNYHMMYNTFSILACSSIAYGYIRYGRNKGPLLKGSLLQFQSSKFSKGLSVMSRIIGLGLLSQSIPRIQIPFQKTKGIADDSKWKARCPMDFTKEQGMVGVKRITRHPTLWSFGLISLSFALATPYLSHVVMFSMPLVFTVIGGAHQDYRFRRNRGGSLTTEDDEKTSLFPFVALLSGVQSWSDLFSETKYLNLTIATIIGIL